MLTPIVIDDVRPRTPSGFAGQGGGGRAASPVSAVLVADGHDRLGARVRWRTAGDRTLGDERPSRGRPTAAGSGSITPDGLGRHELVVEAWTDRYATWRHEIEVKVGGRAGRGARARGGRPGPRGAGRGRHRAPTAERLRARGAARAPHGLLARRAARRRPATTPWPRCVAGHPRRPPLVVGAATGCGSTARAPPTAPGTSCSRAPSAGCGARRPTSTTWPTSASTSCTCRPSTRSASPTARAATTRSMAGPGRPRQPVGHRRGRGRPRRRPPRARHARRLRRVRGPGRRARPRGGARLRPAVLAPTTPGCETTPSGSTRGPTARSATPRTRRRSTRTSTRSSSGPPRRPTGWRCGTPAATCCGLDRAAASASSASTTPTPSRSRSGHWLIDDVHGRHPDLVFLAEAFTAPAMMAKLAEVGFSQSYTYFTWRHDGVGAARLRGGAHPGPAGRRTCARRSGRTRPDILAGPAPARGPARRSRCGSCWPPRWCRPTASTRATSCARTSRPASRNEEYLHSEKYELKDRDYAAFDSLAPLIRAGEPGPPRAIPTVWALRDIRFHHSDDEQVLVYSRGHVDRDLLLVRGQPRPAPRPRDHRAARPRRPRPAATGTYRLLDELTGDAYDVDGRRRLRAPRPRRRPGRPPLPRHPLTLPALDRGREVDGGPTTCATLESDDSSHRPL